MAGKTKDVGGGAATGLSEDFIGQLRGMLGGGGKSPSKPTVGGGVNGAGRQGLFPNQPGQTGALDAQGRANPVGNTQGFMDGVEKFTGGGFEAPNNAVDTSGLKALGQGDGFKFDAFDPNAGKVNFDELDSGIDQIRNFKPEIGAEGVDTNLAGNAQFGDALSQLQKFTQGSSPIGAAAPKFDIASYGSPGVGAATNLLNREKMKNQADLRARFGADGGAAFGTPAAYAEGNYLAEADAQNANTVANLTRQDSALDLERALGVGKINSDNYRTFSDGTASIYGTQGRAASDLVGNVGDLVKAGGNMAVNQRGQDLDAQIASGKLSLDAIAQATGLEVDKLKAASAQGISIQQLVNDNQKMRADDQTTNKGLNIEALAKGLGLDLTGNELNSRERQFNTGQQGDMIRSIMDIMTQLSGKGISQRQTIQTPGIGSQILKGVTGLAGAVAPLVAPGAGFLGKAVNRVAPAEIGFNEGGQVPGQGNRDTVPAMLTPGEIVLNKQAVKLLGNDFLNKLNSLTAKPAKKAKAIESLHFNAGGQVPDKEGTWDRKPPKKAGDWSRYYEHLSGERPISELEGSFRGSLIRAGEAHRKANHIEKKFGSSPLTSDLLQGLRAEAAKADSVSFDLGQAYRKSRQGAR